MKLDCGENSCYFATPPGGIRTNGGCRCFKDAGFDRSAISSAYRMLPELLLLREERAIVLRRGMQAALEALHELEYDSSLSDCISAIEHLIDMETE